MRVLLIFLTLVKCSFAQYGTLIGNVYDKKDKSPRPYAVVLIEDVKKSSFTNINGDFLIDSVSIGEHVLKVTCLGCSDTILKINIANNEKLHFNFKTPFNCSYNWDIKTCPICKKTDLVIPIVYGLIVVTSKRKKRKGPEFYQGGCVIPDCGPNWYCKRDDKRF